MPTKICTICEVEKDLDEFYRHRYAKDRRQSKCKDCSRSYSKKYAEDNPERMSRNNALWRRNHPDYARAWSLKRRYHLTLEQFDALLEKQGGCAICGRDTPDAHGWQVDHDHSCCPSGYSCGKCVRGILCAPCNKGLGHFGDNPDRLIVAAEYLKARTNDVLGVGLRLVEAE